MKTKQLFHFFILLGGLFLLTGCDLEIQKPYDFQPEVFPLATFEDQTVWEWLQTQQSPNGLAAVDQYKFDFLIEAIQLTGMQEEFNRKGDKRTFLLLNNNAFDDANEILQTLTGSTKGSLKAANVARLRNVLMYHIVEEYVLQIPTLEVINQEYMFQTMIPGEDGLIVMQRNDRYSISVNNTSSLSTTARAANVRSHNFRFNNGIGHILNDYVRNRPF
ncbi:MAG: fasciclin domain-containing protein [Bacteroidetes bacterium]|nr:fasciclin domain-containing protein [Bacteroidota bacterium]